MYDTIEACLFSTAAGLPKEFSKALEQVPNFQFDGPFTDLEALRAHLTTKRPDVALVMLDPDFSSSLNVVAEINKLVPGLGVIGVGSATDPNSIIAAMRAGCTQYVPTPVDAADLRSAIDRLRAVQQTTEFKSRRICVVGASGGVGSTMLACNLAREIAQVSGRYSALVDLNLEYGDIAAAYDCKPQYSLADVCKPGADVDRHIIEAAITTLPCKVAILGRPEATNDAYGVTPEGVSQTLALLGKMYPHVVVDLPRSFGFLSTVALTGTHLTLVVAQLSVPSIRNTGRVFEALLQMGADESKVEIVINRWRGEHDRVLPDDVERQFNRPVFALIPNDYRRVSNALDFGHPILEDAPSSPARLAIHELAKAIALEPKPDGAPAKRGLFGKLWSKKATV